MRGHGRSWAVLASLLAVVAVIVAAPGAWAGQPQMVRIEIDETSPDAFLSAECATDVVTTARGHIIVRVFDREKGLVELTTLNIELTARAGDNSYRFRDVGADQLRVTKDGLILSIIGQVPFDFIGVLKINLDTGEVVHEPGHLIGDRLEEACAALTA
jgi:hypothetical protein